MKKVLIQVISVITLVFGTCYQSVIALANDTQRVEVSAVQLSDSQGSRPNQAKVGENYQIDMTVTINSKDGDQKSGETAVWLPEDQLKLMKARVEAEATVPDTEAQLIFDRRKSNELRIRWENVSTQASFKLHLPVQLRSSMTSMALPLAVGSQKYFLQPLTVVAADATEEQLKEAGEATDLPTDLLGSLDAFIQSQQAQEAADAEAKKAEVAEAQKKAEAEAQKKAEAKVEAAKEAEKQDADKKAEQEAADKKKADAKTKEALKTNGADASAEADSDAATRESSDKKAPKAATDLGAILKNNEGKERSLFDSIKVVQSDGTVTEIVGNDSVDITDLGDFTLTYEWNSTSLLKKLNGTEVKNGDFYTFRIYGLEKFNGQDSGTIEDSSGKEYAHWQLKNVEADDESYQEITITFTNEMMNITNVNYQLKLNQTYKGENPIDFEFNDEAIWTVDPIETKALLTKTGQFIGDNQIEWKVTLPATEKVNGRAMQFKDIVLNDWLVISNGMKPHAYRNLDVYYSNDPETSLKGYFDESSELTSRKLVGNSEREVTGELTFKFVTDYEDSVLGSFQNKADGQIGEKIILNEVQATVATSSLEKSYAGYNAANGLYSWAASLKINLTRYGSDTKAIQEAVKSLKITDTLTGAHVFDTDTTALQMKIGELDITEYFEQTISNDEKTLVLVPKDDTLTDLIEALQANSEINLTYKTKESGQGSIGNAQNNMTLEMDGGSQDSNGNSGGQSGALISKSNSLVREVNEDGKAHVKWTLTVNQSKRHFTTLRVVDVLPEGVSFNDVESIKIDETTLDLDSLSMAGVTITKGYANKNATGSALYSFNEDASEGPDHAIQFVFDQGFSGKKIKIEIQTKHDWNKSSHTNRSGAMINDERYQYADSSIKIEDKIRQNVYKNGELKINSSNPESTNNTVKWTIGIGTRLNNYFGGGDKQVKEIEIRDWLNKDGAQYLSFSDNSADYKLYAVDNDGKNPVAIDGDHYDISWEDGKTDERTIKITFTDKSADANYANLQLVFETPINLSAWEEFNKDNDNAKIPDTHIFYNNAEVMYDEKIFDEVGDDVSLTSTGIYGQKDGKSIEGNQIQWNVIINGMSKNIGYPTIKDTLTGNHIHEVDPEDFELAFVSVKHSYDSETNGSYKLEVDTDEPMIPLKYGEDYVIKQDDNQTFTLKMNVPVNRPLLLKYKTTMQAQSPSYGNKVSVSAGGNSLEIGNEHGITGEAFVDSWAVRFLKIDGDTEKPLPGAEFKLQWLNNTTKEWEDAQRLDGQSYDTVTSNAEGYVQFHLLGTLKKYRIVEIASPENYNSQMAEFEFDYDDYNNQNWNEKNPVLKNYKVETGNLTLSKATTKLSTPKQFTFEVRALNKDGTVNTNFNREYDLNDHGKVKFSNGVSDEITVSADSSRTILGLPIDQVDDAGNKTAWYYDVRETSQSPDYNTKVAVNDATPEAGNQSQPFTLNPNTASAVTVYFENTSATGDLEVRKVVSSGDQADHSRAYKFTVTADPASAVAGKTYNAEQALKSVQFNDEGVATFELTGSEAVTILGLPEAVKFTVDEEPVDGMTESWAINNHDFDSKGDKSVTTDSEQTQLVTYKNTRQQTGQIQLVKQIKGDIEADKEFEFQIESTMDSGVYRYDKYDLITQKPGEAGSLTFKDGKANIKLTGNEYVMLSQLPLGVTFTISELDPNDKSIVTSWKTASASEDGRTADPIQIVDADDITNVTFTNAKPNGAMTLNKKVISQHAGDQAQSFTFKLQAADDNSVDLLSKTEFAVDAIEMNKIAFDENGQASVTLHDGQSIRIKGLPAGVKINVTETDYTNFDVSYNIEAGDETAGDTATIDVKDDTDTTVNFTNTRQVTGHLLLEKRAEGQYPTDKAIKFTVKTENELNGEYETQLRTVNGDTVSNTVTFTDGETELSFKPGETVLIKNLPLQKYWVTEEGQASGVNTTWESDETDGDGTTADPVTLKANNTSKVMFINEIRTGHLTLNKWVASHADSDLDKQFDFVIQASRRTWTRVANKPFKVTGIPGVNSVQFDSRGRLELKLKADQQITISDLPEGVRLSINETDVGPNMTATWNINNQGGYEDLDADNPPTVTVGENTTQVVSYKNVRDPVGSLRVDKVVTGAFTDDKRAFDFNVTADNELDGDYELLIYSRQTNQPLHQRTIKFDQGTASFNLNADQYAVINGLPLGDYTVSEEDPNIDNMTTTWSVNNNEAQAGLVTDKQSVTENSVPRITFTNALHSGDLVLEKQVTGVTTEADMSRTFEFTVEAQKLDGEDWTIDEAINGQYTATRTTASGSQITTSVNFIDGVLTTNLKANEQLRISNLPSDLAVVVTETNEGEYVTSHRVNGGQIIGGNATDVVTIEDDKDQAVKFINDRPEQEEDAWLALTKSVTGTNGDRDRAFDFTIRFLDRGLTPITGTVNAVKTLTTGGYETLQMMLDEDGQTTFSLAHGETIRWQLPNGAHYQITEDDYTADGYVTSYSQGLAPERDGTTATGVVTTTDPISGKVIYYNRAEEVGDDEAHTDGDTDTTIPDFVDPAAEAHTSTDTALPQAHTSGTTSTGTKGFLPQTGEWVKNNWLAILGLVILATTLTLVVVKRKKG